MPNTPTIDNMPNTPTIDTIAIAKNLGQIQTSHNESTKPGKTVFEQHYLLWCFTLTAEVYLSAVPPAEGRLTVTVTLTVKPVVKNNCIVDFFFSL